jgi:3-methylcrotonyl-CoA carboxylase alpha subunit
MTNFILRQGDREKSFTAKWQGSEIQIEMDGETAVFQLISQTEQETVLERTLPDGRRQQWRLAGHKDGEKRTLWMNGRIHHYQRVSPRGGGAANSSAYSADSLAATIPAIVADILVKIGDNVTSGDKLILLESMKMIIPIQAPYNGIVTALNCTQGESVQAGVQLIELEEGGNN